MEENLCLDIWQVEKLGVRINLLGRMQFAVNRKDYTIPDKYFATDSALLSPSIAAETIPPA